MAILTAWEGGIQIGRSGSRDRSPDGVLNELWGKGRAWEAWERLRWETRELSGIQNSLSLSQLLS
jgi:hypothetical protein